MQSRTLFSDHWQPRFSNTLLLWHMMFETEGNSTSEFANIMHILQILLVLPVGSAHVERCFSLLKRILGDWQLSLGTESISKLMRVCSDAPLPPSRVWFSTSSHPLVESQRPSPSYKPYGSGNSKKCKRVTAFDNANDSELSEILVLSESDNDRDKGSENGSDNSSDSDDNDSS